MIRWNSTEAKMHLKEIIDQLYMGGTPEILSDGRLVCLTTYKENKINFPKLNFKQMLLSIPKSNNDEDDFERAHGRAKNIDL